MSATTDPLIAVAQSRSGDLVQPQQQQTMPVWLVVLLTVAVCLLVFIAIKK